MFHILPLNLKKAGSDSDSCSSNSRLLDSADHYGSSLNFFSLSFILVPSFAAISSSQSNDTLSDDTLSNQTFSSLSHSFGENQSIFANFDFASSASSGSSGKPIMKMGISSSTFSPSSIIISR